MPESSRSRVDFPAPLWPTRPTRSPIDSDMVMSRSASTTTTLELLRPIAPPALPRNAFFNDRDLASKMGNSTQASWVSMRGSVADNGVLQVLAGAGVAVPAVAARGGAGRQRAVAHLLQLCAGGHLLGEQRGLDAVEQPLQPAHQLGLGDAQLGVRGGGVLAQRQRQPEIGRASW